MHARDLINDRLPFVFFTKEHQVMAVGSARGNIGGNTHNVQVINFVELGGLGVGGAGHAGETLVQLEIILNSDGGHGLSFFFHLHAFFGFDGLMQTVRPLTTNHLAPGILIDNHHAHVAITIGRHHIVAVKLIHHVRAQGLLK